jgi:hypothetical protein
MEDGTHPVPTIHSASDEAEANKKPSIRSASEEYAPKAGAASAQAPRGPDQQPRPWSPKQSGNSRPFPFGGRTAEPGSATAAAYGMSDAGGIFSEAATFVNQAVERQNEMMSSMLRARGPQDVMMAGSRYLLGGWLAFFEVNVRISQAASRFTEDAKYNPARPGL